jgi:hypothetical protein
VSEIEKIWKRNKNKKDCNVVQKQPIIKSEKKFEKLLKTCSLGVG